MTVVLLDGNNLAMRSWHAAKGSMSSGGVETGALQIFVNSLSRHLRDEKPDRFVCCWDGGGSHLREMLFPDYKIKRQAQQQLDGTPHHELFDLIKRFLILSGIAQWSKPRVEADDLIAAACRQHPGEHIVILSADKDFLQLLTDDIEQVRFSSYNTPTDRWTAKRVIDELGYRPDQIPLMMALTGDTIDGIPGVRGVGPVKALKWLQAAEWDLERVIATYPQHGDVIRLSRALVDLSRNGVTVGPVPVFRTDTTIEEMAALRAFCTQYELRTIGERLTAQTLWR